MADLEHKYGNELVLEVALDIRDLLAKEVK